MKGSRSAAKIGGTTAFRNARQNATMKPAPTPATATPGKIPAAAYTDAVSTAHATNRRTRRILGRAGSQRTG